VVSSDPIALPSSVNCTPATATSSVAAALTVTIPATVVPDSGDVTDTLGGWASEVDVVPGLT
jgi:hypothetical protein